MKEDTKQILGTITMTLVGVGFLTLILMIGYSDPEYHKEEKVCIDELEQALIKVDNASNEVQRFEWQDKTYIVFRYRGLCKANDKLNIKTSTC